MTTTQEALKMAIEWFEDITKNNEKEVLNACKEALEQQEQEPVALHTSSSPFNSERHGLEVLRNTHPAKQLSDDEIKAIMYEGNHANFYEFARAIEAKLKEKNK